jgi:hypothetical protein
MSETVLVAIVGTFGTIVVALAGYVFSERRSNIERAAARELAEGHRQHEERERRKERVFATLRDTYLDVLRQFLVEQQIVDRTRTQGVPSSRPRCRSRVTGATSELGLTRSHRRTSARPSRLSTTTSGTSMSW